MLRIIELFLRIKITAAFQCRISCSTTKRISKVHTRKTRGIKIRENMSYSTMKNSRLNGKEIKVQARGNRDSFGPSQTRSSSFLDIFSLSAVPISWTSLVACRMSSTGICEPSEFTWTKAVWRASNRPVPGRRKGAISTCDRKDVGADCDRLALPRGRGDISASP